MKYFNTVYEQENLLAMMDAKLEIMHSQLDIIYNLLFEAGEITDKEKVKSFDEMGIPMRIAFDYFIEVRRLAKEVAEQNNQLFRKSLEADERLEKYDCLEEFTSQSNKDLEQAMRFLRSYQEGRRKRAEKANREGTGKETKEYGL